MYKGCNALQSKLKKYLQTLKENNIIVDVDEPTGWVHNIVVVEKKDKQLWICLDLKPIDAEISRQQFYYNKRSKTLKPLKKGEKVYCKQGNRRDEAIVVDCDAKRRSYTVQNRNSFIRRIRRHLFHAPSNANFNSNYLCADIDYNYFNDSQSAVNGQRNFKRSRFGRRLNYPRRLDDYV